MFVCEGVTGVVGLAQELSIGKRMEARVVIWRVFIGEYKG